jgi:hypothetical protein
LGIGLFGLGAMRLYAGLKGSTSVPLAGGYTASVEFTSPSVGSNLTTLGLITAGLFLVLGGRL